MLVTHKYIILFSEEFKSCQLEDERMEHVLEESFKCPFSQQQVLIFFFPLALLDIIRKKCYKRR